MNGAVATFLLWISLFPSHSLIEKQSNSPVYDLDGTAAFQDILLTITPTEPGLLSFSEELVLDALGQTATIHVTVPVFEYSSSLQGYIPAHVVVPQVSISRFDDFTAEGTLVQENNNLFLEQFKTAVDLGAELDSANSLGVPINPVEAFAVQRLRNGTNSSGPIPPTRRRLLNDHPGNTDCETQPTVQCILDACGIGFTSHFAEELFELCTVSVQGNLSREERMNEELNCILSGACRAKLQCQPLSGKLSDSECANNVLSEFRSAVAIRLRSQQSQHMVFWQYFFQSTADNLNASLHVASLLSDLVESELTESNATLNAMEHKRSLLLQQVDVLGQLQERQLEVADVVGSYVQRSDEVFASHGDLLANVLHTVEELTTINANLQLSLATVLNALQRENALAKLHIQSAVLSAGQSYSIWQGIIKAFLEISMETELHASMAREVQAAMLFQERDGGYQFFGASRGTHPRQLSPEERYLLLDESRFEWQHNSTTRAAFLLETVCDLAAFAFDDLPRNTMFDASSWIRPCGSPEAAALVEASVSVISDANQSALADCLCWARGELRHLPDTAPLQQNDSLYYEVVEVVAVLNRSALLSVLKNRICLAAGELVTLQHPALGARNFTMDELPEDRRYYCEADPAFADFWVQPFDLDRLGGPPIPFVFWNQWLLVMKAMESTIAKAKALMLGTLPIPCTIQSSTYRLEASGESFFNETISIGNNRNSQHSRSPLAVKTETARFAETSVNAVPLTRFYGKRAKIEERVSSSRPDLLEITQTVLLHDDTVLPGSWLMASYPGCLKTACPVRPTYLDPLTGFVMGVQTGPFTGEQLGVLDGEGEFTASDPSFATTGYSLFLYDVPQRTISLSSSEASRRNTVSYIIERQSNLHSDFLEGRLDYMLGPLFQRPVMDYELWRNTSTGEFRPEHARVSLDLFRTPFQFGAPFPQDRENVAHLANTSDIRCSPTKRRPSSELTPCAIFDRYYVDLNVTEGKLRLYPRSWQLQVSVRVRGQSSNSSNPIRVRPANSDLAGRRLNACPDILEIDDREADFSSIILGYRLLPQAVLSLNGSLARRKVVVEVTDCPEAEEGGAVMELFPGVDLFPFATHTISVPGCYGQRVEVRVEAEALDALPPDMLPKTNSCILWTAAPLTLDIETVRQVTNSISVNERDAVGTLLRDLGYMISNVQSHVLAIAVESLNTLFDEELLSETSRVERDLNETLAFLSEIQEQITQRVVDTHSNAEDFSALLEQLRQEQASSIVTAEDVLRAFSGLEEIRELYRKQQEALPIFQKTLNLTQALAANLSGINFLITNAPVTWDWKDMAGYVRALGNMTCVAEWDQATREMVKAARDASSCVNSDGVWTGFSCLDGDLVVLRYFLWSALFHLLNVPILYALVYSQYCSRVMTRSTQRSWNKALWSCSTRKAPDAARYVRPIIVVAPLVLVETVLIGVLFH